MVSNLELNDRHLCPLAGSVWAWGMIPVFSVRVMLRAVVDTSISYEYQMIFHFIFVRCAGGVDIERCILILFASWCLVCELQGRAYNMREAAGAVGCVWWFTRRGVSGFAASARLVT